ncbi:MAG TPA: HD domain-containing phosphohydrolase [bacterium]|jgi:response regulator RpfG family c-di-GMP phosphodiesterase
MSQQELDLLIVDDDPEILHLLTETLADSALTVQTATGIEEARVCLSYYAFKVVLSDHNLSDGYGVDFLTEMRALGVKSVPILMTGLMDVNVAVEAINRGKVYQFVAKPLDVLALTQTIHRALQHYAALREQERLTREIIEHNDRLRREAEVRERSLLQAADKIRVEEETVERQKAHIESLYNEIQSAYLHTVTSLTAAIEAKDPYTRGHSERVYYYCSIMADVLSLPDSSRQDLKIASVLHDLGKIGIPDSILQKTGFLSADEKRTMASHTTFTEEILHPLPFLGEVRKIISEHHERCDGSGYPLGLKSEQISLEGRILATADSYDAMRSDRAYRRALTKEQAMLELQSGTGSQFCPLCVGALLFALNSRGEFAGDTDANYQDEQWEEDFLRLRPASSSVRVDSVLN